MRKTVTALISHIAIILSLIIVMGILGLIAAGVSGAGNEKFTGEIEHNVTLRILENDTAKEQGYLKELLDAFNAEYAEYGITAVDANMDQYTDLETGGPYGYGPDVLYQANDAIMKYVDGKHILPLPIEKTDCFEYVSDKAWAAYQSTVQGQTFTFGVPVNVQQPLLFYRKDLLPENWEEDWDDDKNGIPDIIENWSDLYRYSQLIRQQSGGNKYGYMKSLNDGLFCLRLLFFVRRICFWR